MGKCITDAFGKVKHWVLSDNDFVYEYSNYERDAYDMAKNRAKEGWF